jgi:mannitol/fructose-specific phosphotransferase system IIA component (Ntr-type)
VLLVPRGTDHVPGFADAVRTVKRMANQLGTSIEGYTVSTAAEPYVDHFDRVNPKVPVRFETVSSWQEALRRLRADVREDDLIVTFSARRGAVSWVSSLERLPGILSQLVPQSFIMLYPSEALLPATDQRFGTERRFPPSLSPARILFNVPEKHFGDVLEELLELEFGNDRERLREMKHAVLESDGLSWEILPGVVVPHVRVAGLPAPLLFLAISPEGVTFPDLDGVAHLVFLLLTPEENPAEHLKELAAIGRLVGDPMRFRGIADARSLDDLMEVVTST